MSTPVVPVVVARSTSSVAAPDVDVPSVHDVVAAADGPATTAPLDRPMRTTIGAPIVDLHGAPVPSTSGDRPTVARELLTPSTSPTRSPAVPAGATGAAPTGTGVPIQRESAGAAPAATPDLGVAPAPPEVRPTLGSDGGAAMAVTGAGPTADGAPAFPSGPTAGPDGPWADDVAATVVPGPASVASPTSADAAPAETRPTLTGEWLPAVARHVQRAGTVEAAASTPRRGPAIGPPVSRLPDAAAPHQASWLDDDRAATTSWSDGPGSRTVPFETTIATLGSGPGLSAPPTPARPTTAPRAVIGPPVSRAALQRSPLTGSMAGPTTPSSSSSSSSSAIASPAWTPTASFAAPSADPGRGSGSDLAEPITEWPTVQFELAGASAPPADGGSPPDTTVMRAEATSGPAAPVASAPAGRSDAEVDDLLRAMYPQLRRQLCRDLLLDRERAGYGTDIRF